MFFFGGDEYMFENTFAKIAKNQLYKLAARKDFDSDQRKTFSYASEQPSHANFVNRECTDIKVDNKLFKFFIISET